MSVKRLCVYAVYDGQNIVDDYIGYMLRELKTCMDCLVVVCNESGSVKDADVKGNENIQNATDTQGNTDIQGDTDIRGNTDIQKNKNIQNSKNIQKRMNAQKSVDFLEKYADYVFFRRNIGLDAGAFKDALCNILGWDTVWEYDELFLINDSFFGPFRPMKDIIGEMDGKKADFWGLTKHGECRDESMGYFPAHIQSFFLAVRRRMLHSGIFRKYWEKLPYFTTWMEVVKKHEALFTEYFAAHGFTYDILADMEVNDSRVIENNFSQYMALPCELLCRRNFPFLKRKPFETVTLDMQTQEELGKALAYIDRETDYDVDVIYRHVIRTVNVADLYRSLHLFYIAPIQADGGVSAGNTEVFIAVFAGYPEAAGIVSGYLERVRKGNLQIRVYTSNKETLAAYGDMGYTCRMMDSDGNCWNEFKELCDRDYVCVIHDADISPEKGKSCTGKSYLYNVWENLLGDYGHLEYIVSCFDGDPRLGFLAPPDPVFADYFGRAGSCWKKMFGRIKQAAEERRLQCRLAFDKQPVAVTDNFWIRGKILRKLFGGQCMDRGILCFLWTYIVQDAGYYSGIVESSEYAAMNSVNQQYYLETIVNKVQIQYGDFRKFRELRDFIFQGAVQDYCRKYREIFIYGTGYMAGKYGKYIPKCRAYIVSDGQPKPEEVDGTEAVYLSEVAFTQDTGVVICLDVKNQEQVIPLLEERGMHHYLCV